MYYVYILQDCDSNRTYVGFTVDINRRLKQHNGLLAGGAKYTRTSKKWIIAAYLTGFPDNISALQCEWRLKNPFGPKKRGKSGIIGRLNALKYILDLDKFTSKSTILTKDIELSLHLNDNYINDFSFSIPVYPIQNSESQQDYDSLSLSI